MQDGTAGAPSAPCFWARPKNGEAKKVEAEVSQTHLTQDAAVINTCRNAQIEMLTQISEASLSHRPNLKS